MRIDSFTSSFPIGQARKAYAAAKIPQMGEPGRSAKVNELATVRSIADIQSLPGVSRSRAIDHIVGGTVHQPISFDGAATVSGNGALPMYTRAADKVEAATGIALGRAIDVSA
ncbi:MAG: hypothetical protein ACR2GY_10445 [Phycisphaerales bacterium]